MGTRDSWVVFSFQCFCFLVQFTTSFNPTCNFDDLRALRSFLDSLESQIDGWGSNSSGCCTWKGILCESYDSVAMDSSTSLLPRIVRIELGIKSHSLLVELFQLENLEILDLRSNEFSGFFPKNINLPSLRHLDIPSQGLKLFLKIDQTQRVLHYNQIRSFPPSLDQSYNMLTGLIWPEFGNLKELHVLDLKYNNISGNIPSTLSKMTYLEALDMSCNNLSGTIPSSLVNLSFLSKFSIAYNQLTGIVPSGGQFHTFPDSSFEGNNGLCRSFSSSCSTEIPEGPERLESESPEEEESIMGLPFGFGGVFGFIITVTIGFVSGWLLPKAET